MQKQKQLQRIISTDSAYIHKPIAIAENDKDPDHARRRQHQRAISSTMIEIAVMYGHQRHSHGSICYTLRDRDLQDSPYAKFTDMLRGLTVVCTEEQQLRLVTAKWNFKCKRRKARFL